MVGMNLSHSLLKPSSRFLPLLTSLLVLAACQGPAQAVRPPGQGTTATLRVPLVTEASRFPPGNGVKTGS